jgi:indole-3-glycerol phosphate synthase
VSRLGQAIAEGDGISVLVEVADSATAGAAERQGADGLVVLGAAPDLRGATQLPLLYAGDSAVAAGAEVDALVVPADATAWAEAERLGLERVVRVADTDDLERAFEEIDPEIVLLSPDPEGEEDPLELLLALLHDVPAGKLAIAELRDATTHDVEELERAGVDAVLVTSGNIAALVPVQPPEV